MSSRRTAPMSAATRRTSCSRRTSGCRRNGARGVIEDAIALGAEGLDLAIIYLPLPYDPAVLEPLADDPRIGTLAPAG